ncbi:palmitoyltransferase ZDHHC17 [Amborella trichopoda]|uniref:S-acyltransferase n=1 Tax=Amborella trichopoda TaxID=13333 RepID=W1PIJ6_AMBTC|nr:palmitoyltransferase ZDHHC17 [Amborella trichopoda]ERN07818.1 hypothetical protein AMTR_s00012p00172390 [Amborella trichopoda]|eukprot:XP_020523950.1 palmitoyltransferase ZDHHC17 [Amborella trichopoda]
MAKLGFDKHVKAYLKRPMKALISLIMVFFLHFNLAMVPRFCNSCSLLAMLVLSACILVAVTACGICCRRLLGGVLASAPAAVFFHIFFIWGVYTFIVRKAVSSFVDASFNVECGLLVFGLCRMLSGDPGFIKCNGTYLDRLDQNGTHCSLRVRYCKRCEAHIWGLDHHCPAFGNCIGEKNHHLFMVLLLGFIVAEALYIWCSVQLTMDLQILDKTRFESYFAGNLAISTTLFCLLQVVWQLVFLMWHIYCICCNIKTDEWVNWTKYSEFQTVVQPEPGIPFERIRFKNPYDKGIINNIKEFLQLGRQR